MRLCQSPQLLNFYEPRPRYLILIYQGYFDPTLAVVLVDKPY